MNFSLLEMLYNIPDIQDLAHRLYLQLPEHEERSAQLKSLWQECRQKIDPKSLELLDRLESAIYLDCALQDRATFFSGFFLAWRLCQTMGQV